MKLKRKAEPARRQRAGGGLGSKPSPFAYTSRRSESPNQARQTASEALKAIRKPARSVGQRIGLLILSVVILFSVVNILSLSSQAKILPLVSGQNKTFLRDESVYQSAADKLLASSIWNRNKITINSDKLAQELTAQFTELDSVSITIPLLAHRPVVYIEPAHPALILQGLDGAFVVSSSGKALLHAAAPEALNQPSLPKLNDQSGLHVELNHQALPANDVDFILTVVAQLNAKQFTVASMTLPPASRELDVQIAGQPYLIKFNLMEQARGQAGTFLATIAQLQSQNIMPAKYVDVRVPGRAYYQ